MSTLHTVWLTCRTCDTLWRTTHADPCWLCQSPGQLTNSPSVVPVNTSWRPEGDINEVA